MSPQPESLTVNISGVPETMLWALYNRAVEARRTDTVLHDPLAIQIADRIAYNYAHSFGKPEAGQVMRAVTIDYLLKDWSRIHANGQVIALGEGLETQFHRVDNGTIRWLSIDLPEVIAIRAQFLPDAERHRNFVCSALDLRWMEEVEADQPIFITAAGLLKYFQPEDVRGLIMAIAERFPNAEMAFDVIPRLLVKLSQRGLFIKTRHYTAPPMPWGLNRSEIPTLKTWHPNIIEVREIPFSGARGFPYQVLLPALKKIPVLRNHLFSMVHLRISREGKSEASPNSRG